MSSDIIALDVGMKRTGLARASSLAKIPEPLGSVETTKVVASLQQLMADKKIEALVVGLPRNLGGQDTPQTAWVRRWVKQAKKQIPAIFYWQDEALTSKLAISNKQPATSKKQKANSHQLSANSSFDEHAEAAAIILQDFLNTPPSQRLAG